MFETSDKSKIWDILANPGYIRKHKSEINAYKITIEVINKNKMIRTERARQKKTWQEDEKKLT